MDKFLEYLESRDQKDLEKDKMKHEENLALINTIAKCVDLNLKKWANERRAHNIGECR